MTGIFENCTDFRLMNLGSRGVVRRKGFDRGFAARAFDAGPFEGDKLSRLAQSRMKPDEVLRYFESELVQGAYLAHLQGPDCDFEFELEGVRAHHRFYLENGNRRTLMLGAQRPVALHVRPGVAVWFDGAGVPNSHWEAAGSAMDEPVGPDRVTWLEIEGEPDDYEGALATALVVATGGFKGLVD